MPLYEYECIACHKHTEKIQKFSDPEITTCPHCSGVLKRVITAPAISFKGGGWYADGYGNAKPASSGESKSEGAKTEAPSSNTDSKSAGGEEKGSAPGPAAAPALAVSAPAASTSSEKK